MWRVRITIFIPQGHMTEHVRTVHEGKKRIYKEVNCQVGEYIWQIMTKIKCDSLSLSIAALWENFPAEVGPQYSHILRPR